jgi:hypothetical protein
MRDAGTQPYIDGKIGLENDYNYVWHGMAWDDKE